MTDYPNSKNQSWLDRPIFSVFPALTGEMFLFFLIILLAIVSRLYNLGTRVMSHDENLHTYFSWLYSIGKGYQHTPLMHGPLLFHLLAATFEFFGASDFAARFPMALSSMLTVILLWKWRRYLGRAGTLVAATLTLISPLLLYYGRYARNEAFIGVFFVLTLYAILRYLETGQKRFLVLLTLATVLHFTSKETAFIYTAQAMLFLAVYLINRVARRPWKHAKIYTAFLIALVIGVVDTGAVLGLALFNKTQQATDASQTAAPIIPGQTLDATTSLIKHLSANSNLLLVAGFFFLMAGILFLVGYGWNNLCGERSFDMLILLATFVIPQLAAFPVKALGWNPLEYQFHWPGWNFSALWAQAPVRTAAVFLCLCAASIVIGLLWNKKYWLVYAALFWGIYILLYTSLFSNWQGFFTGTVGSLGYWLQQQGVHRGDQPWYYYLLIQIPIYEFLPAAGLGLAAYFGFRRRKPAPLAAGAAANQKKPIQVEPATSSSATETTDNILPSDGNYTFPLLMWWALSSLLAYTLAGEKMPWLTVHITLPMILLTGWALGQEIERLDWRKFIERRGIVASILFIILFVALSTAFASLVGAQAPFQGKTLDQLSATSSFLLSAGIMLASAGGLVYLLSKWQARDALRVAALVAFVLMAVLTGRAAIRAAFIHPNDATEYLVYAHGGTGIQEVMDQISTISSRISGEQNLQIAYDNNLPNQGVSWSFKWYLRNYPNAAPFEKPDESLGNIPVIIVDQQNFNNIKPIVGTNYYQINYIRMVWPNQDYFSLTWPRIKNVLTNPAMRGAVLQIWLNRDYSEYARVTGESGVSLSNWQPSAKMELFIRKDIAAQMWEYGISQGTPLQVDPYEKGLITPTADLIFGTPGSESGHLNTPRGLALAPDGSLYVADSKNNRIQHFSSTGNLILSFGQASTGCPSTSPPPNLPLGTFCEPWAVAVSQDGKWVYVTDTWNHRIQKFSSGGKPVKSWGTPNYDPVSSGPFGLWGPRGIAVDSQGHILVADTGNKRVVIYDSDGNFISQFGGQGTGLGQFDEPVGLAVGVDGYLYVADTWNQRIQVFILSADKTNYTAASQWEISGWYSQSLDNKPYLAVDQLGHVFVTDPDTFRVFEFSNTGEFIHTWGSNGTGPTDFGLPSGVAVDSQGRVWVSDAANNRVMRFTLP